MKKLQKMIAILLAGVMMASLLSVNAFAEESNGSAEVPVSNFKCEFAYEHEHADHNGADCKLTTLDCEKHVHDDTCYTEGVRTCEKKAAQDLICDVEPHTHKPACYHSESESCYKDQLVCGEVLCTNDEEHDHSSCHDHDSGCYETIRTCGLDNGEQVCGFDYEHTHIMIVEEESVEDEGAENEEEIAEINETEEEAETPCYEYHAHSVAKECYVCSIAPHTHDRDCLTDEALADVVAVESLLSAAPTLAAMQTARGTTYKFSNFEGENEVAKKAAAATAYDAYIAESFDAREAAQEDYDALPEELQKLVDSDLVGKLAPLSTVLKNETATITKGSDGYTFQSVYAPAYEMSSHIVALPDGTGTEIPQTLILVDADDASENGTWTMNGMYSSGYSNYEVMYCCDIETMYVGGVHYKRLNLEDSPYYDDDAAEHIRGIVTNAYPYVSLEQMKAELAADDFEGAADLTRADVIAAVQTAIWSYANNVMGDYSYYHTFDINNIASSWGRMAHNYANEMYEWWNIGTRKYYTNEAAGARVDSLVEYLTALEGVAPNRNEVVITSVELIGEPVPVLGGNGVYEVALKVKLNSSGSGENDNLILTATAGSGEGVTVDVVYGQTEYVMLVTAAPNDEIVVEISGTQFVPQGVYFYEPEPADVDGDGEATAREVSQNLVGVAMGDTDVYAKESVLFEMDIPEDPASTSLNLLKVNETGKALADAEFSLATDLDGDETPDIFATYITDAEGKAVITGLIPNVEYVLTEIKAPAGYDPITGEIEFVVEQDGQVLDMVFNLPNGVTCDTPEDEQYVLTVVNCETPSGGGGGGNGGGGGGGGSTIIIPEDPVPLAPVPEEPVIIPEEPEFEEILDEEIPLADVPKTGDASTLWLALSALSGTSLAGVSLLGRKKREEI